VLSGISTQHNAHKKVRNERNKRKNVSQHTQPSQRPKHKQLGSAYVVASAVPVALRLLRLLRCVRCVRCVEWKLRCNFPTTEIMDTKKNYLCF